jgi:hypothetical protein
MLLGRYSGTWTCSHGCVTDLDLSFISTVLRTVLLTCTMNFKPVLWYGVMDLGHPRSTPFDRRGSRYPQAFPTKVIKVSRKCG